jgi:hypothetical protein
VNKQAGQTQVAWALLTEGTAQARLDAHRLRHLVTRVQSLVEQSDHKDQVYAVAGDILQLVPRRLDALETSLDRTSYALSVLGTDHLRDRLPITDRAIVDDATHKARPFHTPTAPSAARVAERYLGKQVTDVEAIKIPPQPGVTTLVRDDSKKNLPTDLDREKQVVLPPGSATPGGGGGREIPNFVENKPDNDIQDRPRTLSVPGEEYGHPTKFDYNMPTRRDMTARRVDLATRIPELRKEFLTLVKNVPRVQDVEDIDKLQGGLRKWRKDFGHLGTQIRDDLNGRKHQQLSDEAKRWAAYYVKGMKPFWDLEWEMRGPIDPVGYLRKYNSTDDVIWRDWQDKASKWAARTRRKAQKAWKWLGEVAAWATDQGWYGGKEPVEVIQVESEITKIEGFAVEFRGFAEADDHKWDTLAKLREGLKRFRKQGSSTWPWLVQKMLPLAVNWTFAENRGGDRDAAMTYNGTYIKVTPWGLAAKPLTITKSLAHEMGHHAYQTLLSGKATTFWRTAIVGNFGDLDLREALEEMKRAGATTSIDKELALANPTLYLQLQTLLHSPRYKALDLWTVDGIKEYLEEGGDPVVRVPGNPVTGYSGKSPEEAFCEAVGMLVAYGAKAVDDTVLGWLRVVLPQIKISSRREGYKKQWHPGKRQRRQRGPARRKQKMNYRKNRSKERINAKKRYKKNRRNPQFKRVQQHRRRHPGQHRRRRASVISRLAAAYLGEVAEGRFGSVLTTPQITFALGPDFLEGTVHSVSPMTGMVTICIDVKDQEALRSIALTAFLRSVTFLSEGDIDAFFELVDVEVGEEAYKDIDLGTLRECAEQYDVDVDSPEFADRCEALVGESDYAAMTSEQLDLVTDRLVVGVLEGGGEERVIEDDADSEGRDDAYDWHLYYGEVPDIEIPKEAGDIILYDQEDPVPGDEHVVPGPGEHIHNPPGAQMPDRGDNQPPASSRVVPPGEGQMVHMDLPARLATRYLQGVHVHKVIEDAARQVLDLVEPQIRKNRDWVDARRSDIMFHATTPDEYLYRDLWVQVIPENIRHPVEVGFHVVGTNRQTHQYDGDVVLKVPLVDLLEYPSGSFDPKPAARALMSEWDRKAAMRVPGGKTAATIDEIASKTSGTIHGRAQGVRVKLKRADPRRGIWTFRAAGSQGQQYLIRVKGVRQGNVKYLRKAQVKVSCSCNFFRWQGPEHWAKTNSYLYGKARGTATAPAVKDPNGQHWACKHVLAALNIARRYRISSDHGFQWTGVVVVPDYPSPLRVARAFLGGKTFTMMGDVYPDDSLYAEVMAQVFPPPDDSRSQKQWVLWRDWAKRNRLSRGEMEDMLVAYDLGEMNVHLGHPPRNTADLAEVAGTMGIL